MKFKVSEIETGLKIEITELNENTETALESFRKCSEGKCQCPSNDYQNLKNLDIEKSGDAITLTLTAKEGTKLSKDEIENCLSSTIASVAG